jgi:rSAM/selenodomain-associated transferase 1
VDAEVCIEVFARAPEIGFTKTRLIPSLGAAGAAALHERLVRRTLRTTVDACVGPVQLWCTPNRDHDFFADCAARYGVTLHEQGDGDLGIRMERTLTAGIAAFGGAILVGCDCPVFSKEDFREAARLLKSGVDVVMTPAEDGGYTLIAASRVDPSLFTGIAWGGDEVMTVTRKRLRVLQWNFREMRTLWDVDRPEDLARLQGDPQFNELLLAASP